MKFIYPENAVHNILARLDSSIAFAKEIGRSAKVKQELLDLYDHAYGEIQKVKKTIEDRDLSLEYANQFVRDLELLSHQFPADYEPNSTERKISLDDAEKPNFKRQQENQEFGIRQALSRLHDTFDFFDKLGFLNDDLVIVGANGVGKTTLAEVLKEHIKHNGVVVSAQRILILPRISSLKIASVSKEELREIQIADKRNKGTDVVQMESEFERLLQGLLSDEAVANKSFAETARLRKIQGETIEPPGLTALQKALSIWNSVFRSPILSIEDGMNIIARKNDESYHGNQMSDGEKVALFLLAQVLQCPSDGFVIVDEPEMHLHPTIHRMLWDRLETERPDATFIYLTHDLEFAASRTSAKKVWLRSFTYPHSFRFQDVPTSTIPKALLLELLGTQHTILFCEGTSDSLDIQVYSLLFPEYVVKPVGGCLAVIGFTKAYNLIPDKAVQAIGIIDADYHSPERISNLVKDGVFAIGVAEVENILMMECVLLAMCDKLSLNTEIVDMIKMGVVRQLEQSKDREVLQYISAKLNQYFTDTHVSAGANFSDLELNYKEYLDKVDIVGWAIERTKQIEFIISEKSYDWAIRIMNNKGLRSVVERNLRIKDYSSKAIALLKENSDVLQQVKVALFDNKEI